MTEELKDWYGNHRDENDAWTKPTTEEIYAFGLNSKSPREQELEAELKNFYKGLERAKQIYDRIVEGLENSNANLKAENTALRKKLEDVNCMINLSVQENIALKQKLADRGWKQIHERRQEPLDCRGIDDNKGKSDFKLLPTPPEDTK